MFKGTETEGKKGAVSVPFHNARVSFCTIFAEDDKNKPEIPIHPNCRCKYEELTTDKVAELQQNVQTAQAELIKLGTPIAETAIRLLAEFENEIKESAVSNTLSGTLQMLSYAEKINRVQKELESKVETTVETNQLKAKFTALQITLAAMQKINQTAEIVQSTMRNTGKTDSISEFMLGESLVEELTKCCLWHYDRLNLPEQQLDVLPKSSEDAEKHGFIKQPDDKTVYHRHKGQTGNLKYCHPTTGQEIIFNEYGKVVTIPENIGTKNYGVNPVSIAHVWYDILPYWFWGNSANDRTPWQDRVLGAEKGAKIKTFFENLQKNLDNILKQLNFN